MAEEESLFTKITGYDDLGDMVDGGGQGGSGDTFFGGTNEEYQAQGGTNNNSDSGVADKFFNTVGQGYDTNKSFYENITNTSSDDTSQEVGNKTVYTRADGSQYAINFLGLPYEVAIEDGKVVDKTDYSSMTSNNDDGGYNPAEGMEGITDEDLLAAADSAISQDNIIKMLTTSGIVTSNEDIAALVANPKKFLEDRNASLSDIVPSIDPDVAGAILDPNNPNYILADLGKYDVQLIDGVPKVTMPDGGTANTYDVVSSVDRLDSPQYTVDPVTGKIRDENLVDADDIVSDVDAIAKGVNKDGTVNELGKSLDNVAIQNTSRVIDTSTVSGKLLADELGPLGYVDTKETMLGQLDIISKSFVDASGNPVIPSWAQGAAVNVNRTIAFSGMSGGAAVAAMSAALMEASLPIAKSDAEFFRTLRLENIDNTQEAFLNKTLVLSKLELANLGVRERAAVENAKSTLKMDLTNLDNEQQAEVLNTQIMTDALFEEVKQENLQRRFTAESQNDLDKFYDQLSVDVQTVNNKLLADIKRFNAGEINDATEFRQTLENTRSEFYANLQYLVDSSNVKWRQSVETENTQLEFDAAATDVKAMLDLSQEGLNRTWDRLDSTFDYLFKAALSEEEFELRLLLGEMDAQAQSSGGSSIFDLFVSAATKIAVAKYA